MLIARLNHALLFGLMIIISGMTHLVATVRALYAST